MAIDFVLQVRLIAAQLVALVEKVGDKDKVGANLNPVTAVLHIIMLTAGAAFQEEYKTSNFGDD